MEKIKIYPENYKRLREMVLLKNSRGKKIFRSKNEVIDFLIKSYECYEAEKDL